MAAYVVCRTRCNKGSRTGNASVELFSICVQYTLLFQVRAGEDAAIEAVGASHENAGRSDLIIIASAMIMIVIAPC